MLHIIGLVAILGFIMYAVHAIIRDMQRSEHIRDQYDAEWKEFQDKVNRKQMMKERGWYNCASTELVCTMLVSEPDTFCPDCQASRHDELNQHKA